MTNNHREEITKGRIRLSDGKIKEILSKVGIVHIDRYIVDTDAHDADNELGAADTFGFHFNNQKQGEFDAFYVAYNGALYQRETLVQVGWLLDAFEHEEDERQELRA